MRKPTGLVWAVGVIALLMVLAFTAVKVRACREEAQWGAPQRQP
jgi:hypothetical protein